MGIGDSIAVLPRLPTTNNVFVSVRYNLVYDSIHGRSL